MQSGKLGGLPPYLFVEIDRRREAFIRSGRKVFDLGIGDPDLGAAPELREALVKAIENRQYDRYPSDRGLPRLIDAIRGWVSKRWGTVLENSEILVTIGSKEAIAHLPLAVADPGEVVLVPDPGYPVYASSAVFAGALPYRMPLLESGGFWPDIASIDKDILKKAKLAFFNYPNNPTSALAPAEGFPAAIDFCRRNDIIIVNDAAYSEIIYDIPAVALFPLAKASGAAYIEFFSFSKTFSISGWRIGFAIGSPEVVSALAKLKANIDSGVFHVVQEAVASVMENNYEQVTGRIISEYRKRRDILASGLGRAGFRFKIPEATFYFWVPVPDDESSMDFCGRLLDETGIVATPGVGFGRYGEGYFRLSITAPIDTIREAVEKFVVFRGSV